jgi:uncharacterized protein (TIGR02145 family)
MKMKIQTSGMISFIRLVTVCMAVILLLSIQSCQLEDEALNDLQESVSDEVYLKNATVTSADIDAFIQLINNMVAANELESGIAKSLVAKLENAKKSLANENINTAMSVLYVSKTTMNILHAIENQVNDLQATEKISVETGGILTSVINVFTDEWSCGQPFVDLRDGNIYNTVKIGDQCWMAENLAYLPSVSPSSLGSETEPFYYVYDYQRRDVAAAKRHANYTTYGVLYNWPAAMAGAVSSDTNPSEVQGVCPAGWHLPSDAEWTQLEKFLITNGYNYDGTTIGNKIAKSMAFTTHWYTNSSIGAIGNNLSANNKSGFSALPGGCRGVFNNGAFVNVGGGGYWWSSSEGTPSIALGRGLYSGNVTGMLRHGDTKSLGCSIRCVRD